MVRGVCWSASVSSRSSRNSRRRSSTGPGRTIIIEGRPGVGKSSLLEAGRRLAGRHPALAHDGVLLRRTRAGARLGGGHRAARAAAGRAGRGRARSDLSGPAASARRLFERPAGEGAAAAADTLRRDPRAVRARGRARRPRSAVCCSTTPTGPTGPRCSSWPISSGGWPTIPSASSSRRARRARGGNRAAAAAPRRAAAPPCSRSAALDVPSVTGIVHAEGFAEAGPSFCQACWQVTAGNPFYLHELLRELRDDRVDPERGAEELLRIPPPSVTRSVLVRLGRLPTAHAAELARAAAVLGDGATLRHAAAHGRDRPRGGRRRARRADRGRTAGAGEPLHFVHPLVRAAVYADIPPAGGPCATLGRRNAGGRPRPARARRPAPCSTLRWPRRPDTVRVLRAAAGRARGERCARRTRCRYLRRALLEPPPPPSACRVLGELAGAGDGSRRPGGGRAPQRGARAHRRSRRPRRSCARARLGRAPRGPL